MFVHCIWDLVGYCSGGYCVVMYIYTSIESYDCKRKRNTHSLHKMYCKNADVALVTIHLVPSLGQYGYLPKLSFRAKYQ